VAPSPFPVPTIDPSNFYRTYEYLTFNSTIKALQYNLFHKKLDLIAKIDLSQQCITDEKLELFCNGVRGQKALTQLNLSKNDITNRGMVSFTLILRSISSLKTLNLSWNSITDFSISILANPERYSSSLEELNLQFNAFTSLSAYYLSLLYTKEYHCCVKKLHLGGNINHFTAQHWGNDFLKLFIGKLVTSEVQRLEELNLNTFNITEEGYDCILLLLFANRKSLRTLNISNNFIESKCYRTFFMKIIQLLVFRNQQYYQQYSYYQDRQEQEEEEAAMMNISENGVTPRAASTSVASSSASALPTRSFKLLAYDCGFSLKEIKFFQDIFIQSELLSTAITASPTASTPHPSSPFGKSSFQSTKYYSLQSVPTCDWKSLLILGNKLYQTMYQCYFSLYQLGIHLLNNWKTAHLPLKYRPPIVMTYQRMMAMLHRHQNHHAPNNTDVNPNLPLIPLPDGASIGSRRSKKSGLSAVQEVELISLDDMSSENTKQVIERHHRETLNLLNQAGGVLDDSSLTSGSLQSLPPPAKPSQQAQQSTKPKSSERKTRVVTSARQQNRNSDLNSLQQRSLDDSSLLSVVTGQTFIYHNESSLLASLTKRLNFSLEKLFQTSANQSYSNARISFYLKELKLQILLLNDELNYVHFYQELIGQLHSLDYIKQFSRAPNDLVKLYSDLEKYHQTRAYKSMFAPSEKTGVGSVSVQLSRMNTATTTKGGSNAYHGKLSPMNTARSGLLTTTTTNGPGFGEKIPIIPRVFTEEMIKDQISFYLETERKSKHYLYMWNQCIDYCLLELEKNFQLIYDQYHSPHQRQSFVQQSQQSPTSPALPKVRNNKTIVIPSTAKFILADQQQEQLMFLLEDCYGHTIRKGSLDEELIGCLYHQNIIFQYTSEKQKFLSEFQQREEREMKERELLERQQESKLKRKSTRRSQVSRNSDNEDDDHKKKKEARDIKDPLSPSSKKKEGKKDSSKKKGGKGTDGEDEEDEEDKEEKEKRKLAAKEKYHLKHHFHGIKRAMGEDEKKVHFLALSFQDYVYSELNINFEIALCYLSYFFHYYCFIYQKEKLHV